MLPQHWRVRQSVSINKENQAKAKYKNKCVSSNGSENFRKHRHICFCSFSVKKYNFMHLILKGILPFKMHKMIFFPENLKKI